MKKIIVGLIATVVFINAGFAQITLPKIGETLEFNKITVIPSSFDLRNVDDKPYNFLYLSEYGKAFSFNLRKSNNEIKFGMSLDDAKNSTIDFFDNGTLVGSFPVDDFPQYQTNVHLGVIIAVVVAACCVKVKYKTTTTTIKDGKTQTTTTWEFGWDCDCLSISFRNGQPPKAKIILNGNELEFDNFTITKNSKFNEKDFSLIISH